MSKRSYSSSSGESGLPEVSGDVKLKRRKTTTSFVRISNVATKQAIAEGYIQLFYGRGVNEKDPKTGKTPLIDATMKNDLTAVFVLLEVLPDCYNSKNNHKIDDDSKHARNHVVDINAKSKQGNSPLYLASRYGHYEIAEILIKKGANINAKNKNGDSPLHIASLYGHYEIAEILIKKGANINAKSKQGNSPLHLASLYGHYEIAKLLIEKGANIEQENNHEMTPLLKVCSAYVFDENCIEIAKLLLGRGADIDCSDDLGRKPLKVFLDGFCLNDGDFEDDDKKDFFEFLVQNEADIDGQIDGDEYGSTLLHQACEEGNYAKVKFLLDLGADIDQLDNRDKPPLQIAFDHHHGKIFKLLLEKGADVNLWNTED